MVLRLAPEVSTRRVGETTDDAVPASEVWLEGRRTGTVLSGAVLEAAVLWGDRYLLFMTDDVPHEDTLGIHLLDERLTLLDSARLGGLYSTGTFSGLELLEPDTVRFRFIGDTTWSVELLDRPSLRIPFLRDAPGVFRPWSFSRHFIVRGEPQPEVR